MRAGASVASPGALGARRSADPAGAYVPARVARRPTPDDALVGEVADLWFHCMVLLVHLGEPPQRVLDVLAARFGISGHEEKRSRGS